MTRLFRLGMRSQPTVSPRLAALAAGRLIDAVRRYLTARGATAFDVTVGPAADGLVTISVAVDLPAETVADVVACFDDPADRVEP